MDGKLILNAGVAPYHTRTPVNDPRRDAVKRIRAALRDPASSDEQVDDALEALLELTKE